jgi:arylformamidase
MKVRRRKFLYLAAGSAASTAIMGGKSAAAQPAPPSRVRGPLVWLEMDQKELDDAYDQFVYAPNARQIIARCHRNSELVRERIGAPTRLA